jgi:hypothetical protein
MADSFDSPEAAARGDTPARFAHVVAVEYSPSGEHALVFAEFNEPPRTEPYEVLCEPGDVSYWVAGFAVAPLAYVAVIEFEDPWRAAGAGVKRAVWAAATTLAIAGVDHRRPDDPAPAHPPHPVLGARRPRHRERGPVGPPPAG